MTYDEIRPGCYDRDARVEDFALNWVDGSLRLSAQLLGRDNSVLVKNRRYDRVRSSAIRFLPVGPAGVTVNARD